MLLSWRFSLVRVLLLNFLQVFKTYYSFHHLFPTCLDGLSSVVVKSGICESKSKSHTFESKSESESLLKFQVQISEVRVSNMSSPSPSSSQMLKLWPKISRLIVRKNKTENNAYYSYFDRQTIRHFSVQDGDIREAKINLFNGTGTGSVILFVNSYLYLNV